MELASAFTIASVDAARKEIATTPGPRYNSPESKDRYLKLSKSKCRAEHYWVRHLFSHSTSPAHL